MKVIFNTDCLLHNPPHEFLSGKLVPYLESPDRIVRIKHILGSRPASFELIEADRASVPDLLKFIRLVHNSAYLDFLQVIYYEWVRDGGSKVCQIIYRVSGLTGLHGVGVRVTRDIFAPQSIAQYPALRSEPHCKSRCVL